MKKRYWLRGLLTGIVVYALLVLYAYWLGEANATPASTLTSVVVFYIAIIFLPIIPLSLLIGWILGKIKIKNKI